MYSDIDLDANGIEMEFQASMEELLWFVNQHLANTGRGNFEGTEVKVIFDRDVLINETEVINNCKNSVGILSDETIVKMHPWVSDPGRSSSASRTKRRRPWPTLPGRLYEKPAERRGRLRQPRDRPGRR